MQALEILTNAAQDSTVGKSQGPHSSNWSCDSVPHVALGCSHTGTRIDPTFNDCDGGLQQMGQAGDLRQHGTPWHMVRPEFSKVFSSKFEVPNRNGSPELLKAFVPHFRVWHFLQEPYRTVCQRYDDIKLSQPLLAPHDSLERHCMAVLSGCNRRGGSYCDHTENSLQPASPLGLRHTGRPMVDPQKTKLRWLHFFLLRALKRMVSP